MNKGKLLFFGLFLCGLYSLSAQELPRISPTGTLIQKVGLVEVRITYGRPSVRGRKGDIWGELVPFGQLWRTGANEATRFSVSEDVTLNGKALSAGTYALFTIPRKREDWDVILTTDTASWGTDGYDPEHEVLRIRAEGDKSCKPVVETLRFSVEDIDETSAQIVLHWEKRSCRFRLETDTHAQAMKNIRNAIAALDKENPQPDDWKVYARSAEYYVQEVTQNDADKRKTAMEWVEEGLEIHQKHYLLYWLKARLLAQKTDFSGAIDYARKAIRIGVGHQGNGFESQERIRRFIRSWETKR